MTHMPPSSACPSDTLKHLGSSTQYDQLPYQVWWASVKALSRYCAEMAFTLKVAATLTFDLVTPKTIGVFYTLWPTSLTSLVNLGQSVLKILRGNGFYSKGHRDLVLWPSDPKTIGVLYILWPTSLPSLVNLGQSVLKISCGNDLVYGPTDGPTDRPTDISKTICPHSVGGGHN